MRAANSEPFTSTGIDPDSLDLIYNQGRETGTSRRFYTIALCPIFEFWLYGKSYGGIEKSMSLLDKFLDTKSKTTKSA